MRSTIQKGLFGMVVAAGLCFGAAQAGATPAEVETVRACTNAGCNADCIRRGFYVGGRCVDGECICYDDAR